MIFRLFDLLLENPAAFLVVIGSLLLALLLAISVHEFSHALVATALGDDTAKRAGRLTLNPLAHLDPAGTLMLLIVGFGWGRPVPVTPGKLRSGPTSGMAMVAFAGPLSNILFAGLVALSVRARLSPWHPFPYGIPEPAMVVADIVGALIIFNVVLAVFNLIPLAPLDGFNVLVGLLPRALALPVARLARYGPMILIGALALDVFTNVGIFSRVLGPALRLVSALLVGRQGL